MARCAPVSAPGRAAPLRGRVAALLSVVAALALSACDALVDVNASATVPARYLRVLVTVEEVWFHQSATATPEDEAWVKLQLDDARTLDLVALGSGTQAALLRDAVIPTERYRQLRLLLADTHGDLHDSAEDAGADYNNEVTWIDADGDLRTAPLEVLDAQRGIGMQIDLKVVEAAVAVGGASARNAVQVKFDATRGLTEFRRDDEPGFLLNASLTAFDEEDAGTIRGTLDLSRLGTPGTPGTIGLRRDIHVTAQKLDSAAGRRVIVGTAAVGSTGNFLLYPLPLDDDERVTEYDLVVHGPEIETMILRDVPVSEGAPGTAQPLAVLTLEPAQSFEANISATAPLASRGASVGFYQSLPGENEPFLVGFANVDPLSGRFAEPVRLSRAGTVLHGRHESGFDLRSATPQEGAGRYAVAAFSPHFAPGAFADTTLRAPASASDTAAFTVPAPGLPATAVAGTVSTEVTVGTPARHDRGVLVLSHEASTVAVGSLDAMLQQSLGSAFIELADVPAGGAAAPFDPALYRVEAWAWHSADPEDTFTRHAGEGVVDLRTGAVGAGAVTVQ